MIHREKKSQGLPGEEDTANVVVETLVSEATQHPSAKLYSHAHQEKDGDVPDTAASNESKLVGNQKEADATLLPSDGEDFIAGVQLIILFTSLTLVTFLMLLDISVIATAIPRITSDFSSLPDVGWYGSAYLLANCSLQPLAGKIYTHFNARSVFLIFFAIFEFGSLLCGVATSSKMLIIGRAIAGMGGSGLLNGAMTILSRALPIDKRPVYFGAMIGIGQMGVVIGPLIGGAFTEYTTWRWCFYINLPIGGLVATLLLLVRIPDPNKTRQTSIWETIWAKLDLLGFALFCPSIIQLLLALDYGGKQYAWSSSTVIGLFCGAGATFIAFLIWEYFKGDEAIIPLSMFKQRVVWSSCGFFFFFFAMIQLVIYYMPIYFQTIKEATPTLSGVYLLPSIFSQLFGTIISGAAVTRLGYYTPFCLATGILTSIGHGLLATLSPFTSTAKWVGYQIILGFSRGLGMQMPFIAVQNTLSPTLIPISTSLLSFTQTLGGAIILSIGEAVFSASLQDDVPKYAEGVDATAVVAAGATKLKEVFTSPPQLAGILIAYSKGLNRVFYVAVGCSCACFLFAWGLGWQDIRKKSATEKAQVDAT